MKLKKKILIGNCLEQMKKIENSSISLIVTSPPYNIKKKYGAYKDDLTMEGWKELIDKVFVEAKRILKPNGSSFKCFSVPDSKTKKSFHLMLYVVILKKIKIFIYVTQ